MRTIQHFGLKSWWWVSGLPAVLVLVGTVTLSAHDVIGRRTRATAKVQSPNPGAIVDYPIPLVWKAWDTGLSVVCIRVTNNSPVDSRITAVGLELPGDLSGFSLLAPTDAGFSIEEEVEHVPGFPGVTLDFALVTGRNFTSGKPRLGLPPATTPTVFCVSGPFDRTLSIEQLLNGAFVRFQRVGDDHSNDVGVWVNRQPSPNP